MKAQDDLGSAVGLVAIEIALPRSYEIELNGKAGP